MLMKTNNRNIVIIGAGMAGCKLAQSLVESGRPDIQVTLIGEEAKAGYNRIMLSPLLAKEITTKQINFVDMTALCSQGLRLITNDPAVQVSYKLKQIILASGVEVAFDEVVFATGSRASQLAQFPENIGNIHGFRNLNDVSILENINNDAQVVVIGGGLLGLEAAVGLVKRGLNVSLVHRAGHILNRQLDVAAAELLQAHLEALGIKFFLGHSPSKLTHEFAQDKKIVTGVTLEDGTHIECNTVVLATGITPEVSLAKSSGLLTKKAIVVNEYLQTSKAHTYAIGECTEFNGQTFGLVDPIWKQLEVLVSWLLNAKGAPSNQNPKFKIEHSPTKLKVSGVNLYSVGDIGKATDKNSIVLVDRTNSEYRKIIIDNGVIVAAILYGNISDGPWYFSLIQTKANVSHLMRNLIFGEAYCNSESVINHAA
ncbi:FAD-dependent oxidoreductase [Reinekea marina]|uniref:NAD(P)/FAD-dependent oxidoreductase n=1 Tax=Reinekea marina TaxID=1310421 RepID=A0ABV7WTC8_9GAMM|nr:FAD-dependent oxidoreductase [Reinekea marina]MDN3649648.1 FAD-dependent oxidoreductase [Reinekea marina]